jgi:hypothetical protein
VTEGAREQGRSRQGAGRRSFRAYAWLAWALWVLCVGLFALSLVLLLLTPPVRNKATPEALIVLLRVMALTFPTVGALIASQRPENPIGWILCGTGLFTGVRFFAEAYADFGLVGRPGLLPAAEYMAWIASWSGMPVVALASALLLVVFPDGKLLDRSWWTVVWMAVGGAALVALWMALDPEPWTYHPIDNPLALESGVFKDLVEPLGGIGAALLVVSCLCAAISLLIRVDKGSPVERQQIKWLGYFTILMLVVFAFVDAGDWGVLLSSAAFNCLPVGVGIAVLRYRLFDIDVLINRTLVYGALTATLVALYFGGIVLLQTVFVGLTGQKSPFAVVASTLTIAALFNPLRRRIQSFIDRRFYRRKYDARKTLESFSAKLRDETDLDALSGDLVGVVRETMQPAHVSLWLRPDRIGDGSRYDRQVADGGDGNRDDANR